MATRLYLHREGVGTLPSGTLPSSEQSSLTADANLFDNEDGSENRVMDTTISAQSQTTLTNTSTADTNAHNYYIARWVSPKINQTSIAANTWTLEFGNLEGNANANFPRNGAGALRIVAYVWKPSNGTKYADILDGNSAADFAEAGTSQSVNNGTFSGAAVSSLTANDAVIVFELWAIVTQAMGTAYTQTIHYDGTTEGSTSNIAAYLETPENLSFESTVIERACNETITISPSIARTKTAIRAIAESVTVADSLARFKLAIRAIAESVTIADSLTETALHLRSIAESITIADVVNRIKIFPRDIAESITISPAITSIAVRVRAIAESITIADSISRFKLAIRGLSQSITIADAVTGFKLFTRAIAESITIADSVSRLKTAIRAISESITIADSLSKVATKFRTIAESITIADSISKTLIRVRSISESITIADSVTRLKTAIRGIAENITISDSVTRIKTAIRNMTENISISDIVDRLFIAGGSGQLFIRAINETIGFSDSITLAIFKVVGGRPPGGNIFRRRFEEKMKKTWRVDWRKMLNKRLGIE